MKRVSVFAGLLMALSTTGNAGSVSGIVRDALTSVPLAGVTVSAHILLPDSIGIYDTTDAGGAFALPGIPSGNQIYVVLAYSPGYKSFYSRFANLGDGAFDMDVLLEAELSPPPGGGGDSTEVSGFVLGQEGSGGSLVRLSSAIIEAKSGLSSMSTTTDAIGHYSMKVKTGSYGISVSAQGYQTSGSSGISITSTGLSYGAVLEATTSGMTGAGPFPRSIALLAAYPNPFNPTTVIGYQLPAASTVRLSVYDLLGREVGVLVEGRKGPGSHEVRFEASGLPSGAYLYRLTAGNVVQSRKMIVIK